MSKVLNATCAAGVVLAGEPIPGPVASAEILSKGIGPSTGILIMDKDKATYVTSNASDLESTLTTLASVLTDIATTLTSIGASMTGPTTAPPPTLAVDVAKITAAVVQINLLKAVLK